MHDVPPQDIITRDNVSVKVNAVVYFRVIDPRRAVVEVENYIYATSQLAQTTLRSVLGRRSSTICWPSARGSTASCRRFSTRQTDPWGIKVSAVEVKHVDLPQDMHRAMARQAEAEREKRAKIIHAEGEFIASEKLSQAAAVIGAEPGTMQLRYLQTLNEIARRAELHDRLPAADRPAGSAGGPQAVDGWTLTPWPGVLAIGVAVIG